ncbi:MAG: MarR family transcriptional regulator [Oscillospiraceae bacterium]|jgi:DNA-binding MarR family transcriptional regulator|nr:MarR family transcriptional regulator [Oscillospiraceae bacterium]MDD3260469.1 MarR family transcriptional regulator [Oscillospiraceae bacterium]
MDYQKAAAELMEYMRILQHGPSRRVQEVTQGEMAVLGYVSAVPGTTPSELSAQFDLSSARIANILNSLEKKKYLIRSHDSVDRRKVFVSVTQSGGQVAKQRKEEIEKDMADLLHDLGEQDAAEYLRLMKKISVLAKNHQ